METEHAHEGISDSDWAIKEVQLGNDGVVGAGSGESPQGGDLSAGNYTKSRGLRCREKSRTGTHMRKGPEARTCGVIKESVVPSSFSARVRVIPWFPHTLGPGRDHLFLAGNWVFHT